MVTKMILNQFKLHESLIIGFWSGLQNKQEKKKEDTSINSRIPPNPVLIFTSSIVYKFIKIGLGSDLKE